LHSSSIQANGLLPAAFPAVFRKPSPSVFANRFIQMTTPAPISPPSVSDDYAQQQEITRLCIHAALLLLQYGVMCPFTNMLR